MRRAVRSLLILGGLAGALPAAAQPEQPFEPPAFQPHFTFGWDALARYDDIYHLRVRPDIERGRFQLRPEVGFRFSERFRIGVRAVATYGTDENSGNSANFDNYRSRGVAVERYYLEARPGDFLIHAGAFGMPLAATEMLWDRDIQTPGAAVSYQAATGPGSTLTLAGAGFYGPQSQGDHTRIGAGQAIWRAGDRDRVEVEVAASFWYFDPDDLKFFFADGRPNLIRQNYPNAARTGLLSDYEIADLLVRLRFSVGSVPVLVSLDGIKNFGLRGAAKEEGEGEAFEGNLTIGRVGTPWNWRVFYTFQYVERDAVIGAYNTDDWWFHTWHSGHRIGLAVTVLPNVFFQGSVVFQRRLDRENYLNRILVDLVKMF
ncbi:MAG: putative porin [Thermoanaerobaculia bacterium]